MKNLFERTSSNWVRYSEYEWKEAEDGKLYLTPTKTAQPSIYDPLSEYQRIVLDAINIGRLGTQHKSEKEVQKANGIRGVSGCNKSRLAWLNDRFADYAKFYGLRSGVSAKESFYPRGIHVNRGLFEFVFPF